MRDWLVKKECKNSKKQGVTTAPPIRAMTLEPTLCPRMRSGLLEEAAFGSPGGREVRCRTDGTCWKSNPEGAGERCFFFFFPTQGISLEVLFYNTTQGGCKEKLVDTGYAGQCAR